jgi:outer membrane PBP1 activator LpoA protein
VNACELIFIHRRAVSHKDGDDDDDDNNDDETWNRMNVRRNLLEQAATGAINPQAIEDQVRLQQELMIPRVLLPLLHHARIVD